LTNAPGNVMAASTNGTTLVAGVSGGPIYISPDAGATWLPTSAPSNYWVSVACSADATKLVAATGSGLLLTSTDAGATWGTNFAEWEWGSVASSADGTKFVAAALSGYADLPTDSFIWVSTNSGVSWNFTSPPNAWSSVAMSADGTHLVAVAAADSGVIGWRHPDGLIYLSRDGGITWTNAPAPVNDWTSVAMSSDGAKLVAAGFDAVYISTDYGATWAAAAAPFAAWKALTCSADGSQIAGAGNGVVAILHPLAPAHVPPPLPRLSIDLSSTSASLSWLVPSSRFVLQERAQLTSPNWVDTTNQPSFNFTNLHNEVTMPRLSGNSFYRLRQQ
jgi:hypothetical protein